MPGGRTDRFSRAVIEKADIKHLWMGGVEVTDNIEDITTQLALKLNTSGGSITGNLGINTASPLTKLNIVETVSTSPRGILSSQYSSDEYSARLGFNKAGWTGGTYPTGNFAAMTSGWKIGRLMFRGYDGTSFIESACIETTTTGTIGTGRIPTEMVFYTGTDAATTVMTEALRLTVTQNLKIINDKYITASNYAGTGAINMLKINASDQLEAGAALNMSGYYELANGNVVAMDMPNPSALACSYVMKIGGNNAFTIGAVVTSGAITHGFFGGAAAVKPAALTAALTSITHTAPGTPDYALQDLVQNTGFGFATKDEGNTVLSVILRLQTRVSELESRLQGISLLS